MNTTYTGARYVVIGHALGDWIVWDQLTMSRAIRDMFPTESAAQQEADRLNNA